MSILTHFNLCAVYVLLWMLQKCYGLFSPHPQCNRSRSKRISTSRSTFVCMTGRFGTVLTKTSPNKLPFPFLFHVQLDGHQLNMKKNPTFTVIKLKCFESPLLQYFHNIPVWGYLEYCKNIAKGRWRVGVVVVGGGARHGLTELIMTQFQKAATERCSGKKLF